MFSVPRIRITRLRSFTSSLFGATFVATIVTVYASTVLPHARSNAISDSDSEAARSLAGEEKRLAHRFIEEKPPGRW
ncbi:hypothetical protein EXIGLDRAFT_7220 [Exidia glandulosa HHB12029]|uniref:Uncharacterized protein n=1 Tax=Exidia glandulosa HHB12029 TaxID=1314781 RepID=A0A165QP32_EXIGL|nr:hypothetical protein EXIGLDRAFT_7220 [Exidia glandulosa HHB12029]